MKKTTSQKFSKQLAKYGALTAAITGIIDASGQETIVYTNIADYGDNNTAYLLDMDNSAPAEFTILNYASAIQLIAPASNYIFYASNSVTYGFQGFNNNSILGAGPGAFKYPFALSAGAPISAGASVWVNDSDWQTMNWASCAYSGSQWCGVMDRYLGLKFNIGFNTHYGWARLDVIDPTNWVIKDYAYNSTPNAPINAGQTTSLGIEDNLFSQVKVVALSKSIGLYNLQDISKYSVINMTGQQVLNGETQNKDHVIEAPTLASGVYIVELNDTKSDAVLRKKVVLQ